jgi:hypothetical protein
MEDNKPQHQIDIELTEEIAEGIYSNLAIITHSQSEFVIDFVKTPQHAKRLVKALADNIATFEQMNGKIKDIESPFPINFGGPTAQA